MKHEKMIFNSHYPLLIKRIEPKLEQDQHFKGTPLKIEVYLMIEN
uniref:Uncharacterized protein n=1 Tax=Rhizophora mucronata TaxID=61149 RepID=A0A2P2J4Q4_RHIMU